MNEKRLQKATERVTARESRLQAKLTESKGSDGERAMRKKLKRAQRRRRTLQALLKPEPAKEEAAGS